MIDDKIGYKEQSQTPLKQNCNGPSQTVSQSLHIW